MHRQFDSLLTFYDFAQILVYIVEVYTESGKFPSKSSWKKLFLNKINHYYVNEWESNTAEVRLRTIQTNPTLFLLVGHLRTKIGLLNSNGRSLNTGWTVYEPRLATCTLLALP